MRRENLAIVRQNASESERYTLNLAPENAKALGEELQRQVDEGLNPVLVTIHAENLRAFSPDDPRSRQMQKLQQRNLPPECYIG